MRRRISETKNQNQKSNGKSDEKSDGKSDGKSDNHKMNKNIGAVGQQSGCVLPTEWSEFHGSAVTT